MGALEKYVRELVGLETDELVTDDELVKMLDDFIDENMDGG